MNPSLEPKSRQIRVFISSTFRDMHAERDHLVTVVFPELRERLERLGLEFYDVDLRWGVPEKGADGETANSWAYCKQWIDRVEPFFISLLGQRYGYIPKPDDIRDKADREQYTDLSITEMEIRHAVLAGKLRRRSYFYFRRQRIPEETPAEFKKIFIEDEGKVEKLKLRIRAGSRPVKEYGCRWDQNHFTGLDDFGVLILEDLWSGVLRDERYVSKEIWRRALGADPDEDARYTDESKPLPADLAEQLVALAGPAPLSPLDTERQQMAAFAEARLRWFQGRIKELQTLADFINSTDEKAPRLAAVVALPGLGKSALLGKLSTINFPPPTFLVTHFVGATESSADARVLVKRLLDELDRSGIEWPKEKEPKQDFNSLCNQLANRLCNHAGEQRIVLILDAVNQLSDGHDLVWLPYKLGPQVRVVISCVEASISRDTLPRVRADQQVGPAKVEEKPSPEQRVLRTLERWQRQLLRVPLGALMSEDIRVIVEEYLTEYCKELDKPHVTALCQLPQAGNPLYLLVLLGELRTLGSDDMNRQVPQLIAELPVKHPDTVSLFRWVLQRLGVFGGEAVSLWCLYLSLGRVGMASRELSDLLKLRLGEEAGRTALLIERGLRRHLQRRGGQLDFFHSQLRQAVSVQYGAQSNATELHEQIADYFVQVAKGHDPAKEWETNGARGFAECVFHQVKAGRHNEAVGLLTNFPFLMHKLRVGLLEDVLEDYDIFRRDAPTEAVKRLEIWTDFFREKAHILRRGNEEWPAHKILLQLAVEHADDSPLTTDAERWLWEDRCNWLWLRRVGGRPKTVNKSACLRVFETRGFFGPLGACALPNRQILSWSRDSSLRIWDCESGSLLRTLQGHTESILGATLLFDGRIMSWAEDSNLCIWNSTSVIPLMLLKGHRNMVTGTQMLSHTRILSWSKDRTLRIWDYPSGTLRYTLEGHTSTVKGAAILPSGRIASWGNVEKPFYNRPGEKDCSIRIWNQESGKLLSTLQGHSDKINGLLALTGGDRILSWSDDGTLRMWDSQNGVLLHILESNSAAIVGAVLLADGRFLSWSRDGVLRFWDEQSGNQLLAIYLHNEDNRRYQWVEIGSDILPDGRIFTWTQDGMLRLQGTHKTVPGINKKHRGGLDGAKCILQNRIIGWQSNGQLPVWDSHNFEILGVLKGHTGEVTGIESLSDGNVLSWSEDDTLRLWDLGKIEPMQAQEGHTGQVNGIEPLTDGRILSWSWDYTVRLWDRQSGALLQTLAGHTNQVTNVQVLDDGRILSSSWDKTLRLWDVHKGVLLYKLEVDLNEILGATSLADGRILLWSTKILGLWDISRSTYLEAGLDSEKLKTHPKLATLLDYKESTKDISDLSYWARAEMSSVELYFKGRKSSLAWWQADCRCATHPDPIQVTHDGVAIVSKEDHQVCILHIFHGRNRLTLPRLHNMLPAPSELCLWHRPMNYLRSSVARIYALEPDEPAEMAAQVFHKNEPRAKKLVVLLEELLKSVEGNGPDENTPSSTSLTQPRKEHSAEEIREAAMRCFEKGLWEAAETGFSQLLARGEPLSDHAPKLITCLLNAHEDLLPNSVAKIEALLDQLEAAGHASIAAPLRQQFNAKRDAGKKPWWKAW